MKTPSDIRLSKDKKRLTITFDKVEYPMSSEFLRVHSPSAEVQGHGPGQEVLQLNKQNVEIEKLKPTGSGTLMATIMGMVCGYFDIVFAFPFFLAAILGTFESFLLLIASFYWLQGSILRELSFHAILPPILWGIIIFSLLPLFVERPDRERLVLFSKKE